MIAQHLDDDDIYSRRNFVFYIYLMSVTLCTLQYCADAKHFHKKLYFTTFVKSSMFALYLAGFLLYRSWWYQCQNRADVGSPVSVCSWNLQLTRLE